MTAFCRRIETLFSFKFKNLRLLLVFKQRQEGALPIGHRYPGLSTRGGLSAMERRPLDLMQTMGAKPFI